MKHFHGYFVSKGSRPRDSVVFSLTPLIERMGPQMFEKSPNPEILSVPPTTWLQSHTCSTQGMSNLTTNIPTCLQ